MDRVPRSASLRVIAALFVFASMARVAAGLWLGLAQPMSDDEPEYFDPAVSIGRGSGYQMVPQQSLDGRPEPTAYRMPGPALIMGAVFALMGPSIATARLVSVIVGSGSAPLLYLFTRRFAGERAALSAGLICAVYPSWVFYCTKSTPNRISSPP